MIDLTVQLGPLHLKNPVLTASGTFGYGTEYQNYFPADMLGGIITKTITLEPRIGNKGPRIAETPAGMLNSIGLANVGVDRYINEKLPLLKELDTKVITNIAGSSIDDYGAVVHKIQNHERVDAIEVNISCPNVKKGGLAFGTDPEVTHQVIHRIRQETDKPIIPKLSPNVTDIASIARAAVEAGADILSIMNTVVGLEVDITSRKPKLANIIGGLSGPAIKPIALAKLYQVRQAVKVPLIGLGGIMTGEDAIAFMLTGASAIQVGTANFIHPNAPEKILSEIQAYCENHKILNVIDVIGKLQVD